MAISDGHGLPLAVHVASASPHEVTLVDATLAASFLDALPSRLIGDRGYDSDRLDAHLRETYGIELIAKHRPNRRSRAALHEFYVRPRLTRYCLCGCS